MLFNTNDDLRAPALNRARGVVAYKEIDQSVTNTLVQATDESLIWDLDAHALYVIRLDIVYITTDAADIRFGFSLPDDAAMSWNGTGMSIASAHQNFGNANPLAGTTSFGGSDGTTAKIARASGTILTGDIAGGVVLTFGQFAATAVTTSVLQGSWGILRRLS